MTNDLQDTVNKLEEEYNIVGRFYYSNFFTPNGRRDLHNWLESCWQERFEPKDRLLVIQDVSEVYEYDDLPGMVVTALQKTAAKIDISNCFIVVVTQNKNISNELTQANQLYCQSPDPIGFVLAQGQDLPHAEVIPKNTFCVAPWVHLFIGTDGNVLPCCAGDLQFPLGNINDNSIEEIMNNPATVKLRKNMMSGRRSKECSACYAKEDAKMTSLRQQLNSQFKDVVVEVSDDGHYVNFQPLTLDIRLNKICNLKCRSCGPYYSSAIAQEYKDIYNITPVESLNLTQRRLALQEVNSYLPKVIDIYFSGGEPLLAQENYDILQRLVELNKTDINIQINTNFTTLNYKDIDLLDLFKKFKNIKLFASLDAYGPVAHYVRHGTDWATIEKNLSAVTACSNIELAVTSTVGSTNVESLIELQKTWHNQGLLDISKFKISQIITDSILSIQVLPQHHKDRLANIIRSHSLWCNKNNAQELSDEWLGVLKFMLAQDHSHLLGEFARTTKLLDNHRKESFVEIFPQYADLLNYA